MRISALEVLRRSRYINLRLLTYLLTGHCCVILLAAGKRLDVVITIKKTVQYSVSCPPGMQKVGSQKKIFARSARKIDPTFKTVAPPLLVLNCLCCFRYFCYFFMSRSRLCIFQCTLNIRMLRRVLTSSCCNITIGDKQTSQYFCFTLVTNNDKLFSLAGMLHAVQHQSFIID